MEIYASLSCLRIKPIDLDRGLTRDAILFEIAQHERPIALLRIAVAASGCGDHADPLAGAKPTCPSMQRNAFRQLHSRDRSGMAAIEPEGWDHAVCAPRRDRRIVVQNARSPAHGHAAAKAPRATGIAHELI